MSQIGPNTYVTSSQGIQWTAAQADRVHTPAGLVVTRAVEMASGWVGQIVVDKTIVWESAPQEEEKVAIQQATERVVDRLKRLFGEGFASPSAKPKSD